MKSNQLTYYSLDTKLKAIYLKKQGAHTTTITTKLNIKNHQQIYTWMKWYDTNQKYRLEQKAGHSYNQIQKDKEQTKYTHFRLEISKMLGLSTFKNRQIYLKIIAKYQGKVSLNKIVKWLGISKRSYYRWQQQSLHPRPKTDVEKAILQLVANHNNFLIDTKGVKKRILGYRRIHTKLINQGFKINPKTVYAIMKRFGLFSQITKKRAFFIREQRLYNDKLPNYLNNNYKASRPLEKLCTDITTITYDNGKKLYVSAILDIFNREILAYNISDKGNTNLVLATLNQLPKNNLPWMIHCDRGSTYINPRWRQAVKAKNLIQSYSAKASPQQNACMEACWSSFKRESLYLTQPQHLQRETICQMIHKYFKHYNYNREMKFNNWLTPLAKKHKYYQKLKNQLSPSPSPK